MNLTDRDIDVVDFINTYKAATTKMIVNSVYNNYNVGTRRLKMLVDEGFIKRDRIATGEWVYHKGDKSVLLHNLLITRFVLGLKEEGVSVGDVYYAKAIGGIEVDAQIMVKCKEREYMLLVESEICGSFDKAKYDKLYADSSVINGYSPIVVVIDNKPIDTKAPYSIVRINRGMGNIEELLLKLEDCNG